MEILTALIRNPAVIGGIILVSLYAGGKTPLFVGIGLIVLGLLIR